MRARGRVGPMQGRGSWRNPAPHPIHTHTCMYTNAHRNTRTCTRMPAHTHTQNSEKTQARSATSSRHFGHPLCKPRSWL